MKALVITCTLRKSPEPSTGRRTMADNLIGVARTLTAQPVRVSG
ncbi:hypothetical protein ACWCYL_13100 [Streptomyces sp. 900105755]